MAIDPGSATKSAADSTGLASQVTCDLPTEIDVGEPITAGDVILALVGCQASSSLSALWTPPACPGTAAGFVDTGAHNDAMTTGTHFHVFHAVVTDPGQLPTSVVFASNRAGDHGASMFAARGVNPAAPIDGHAPNGAAAGAANNNLNVTWADFSTTADDCLAIFPLVTRFDPSVSAWGGGITQIASMATANATSSSRIRLAWGYLQLTGNGAVGAKTATLSANRDWRTCAFALAPLALSADPGDPETVEPGQYVTLDGSGSTEADTFDWTQDPTDDVQVILDATDQAVVNFFAPRPEPGGDPITLDFTLTVTGASGTDAANVAITVLAPPIPGGIRVKVDTGAGWS